MWTIYFLSCVFAGFALGVGSYLIGIGFIALAVISIHLVLEEQLAANRRRK